MVVRREKGLLSISNVFEAAALRDLLDEIEKARARGHEEITLDFSQCGAAFPRSMLPLVATVDHLRSLGVLVRVIQPSLPVLRRLFENTNWAHFLDPQIQKSDRDPEEHLAARRFATAEEQQATVNAAVDVMLKSMHLPRDLFSGFEWAVNEVTDNVLNHAESPSGGIVQVTRFADRLSFAVVDAGRGILSSLKQGYPNLKHDLEAIQEAVKGGVTRDPEAGQGNGLAGTLRVATLSGGLFEVVSGTGSVLVREDSSQTFGKNVHFHGTLVYAELKVGEGFKISEALQFAGRSYHPVDTIERNYETEDGAAFHVPLAGEKLGFGTRPAGRAIRTKCENLLNSDQSKPLVIEWKGISVVSSSFADEFLGKLFVSLGPLAFSARVRNVHMEPLIQSLVEKAIRQRVAQGVNGARDEGDD